MHWLEPLCFPKRSSLPISIVADINIGNTSGDSNTQRELGPVTQFSVVHAQSGLHSVVEFGDDDEHLSRNLAPGQQPPKQLSIKRIIGTVALLEFEEGHEQRYSPSSPQLL